MPTKDMHVGYHGAGFDSPAYALTKLYGDCLEQITSGDKLALIAVLAGWLSEDDSEYTIESAARDCGLTASPVFSLYLTILSDINPDDALGLIAALTAQLKGKVYAE